MSTFELAMRDLGGRARKIDPAWAALVVIYAVLALWRPVQAADSVLFVGDAIASTGLLFALAVVTAAYAKASGVDGLIANAFRGNEIQMIVVAALFGALSPFCSCGVIPLIAALLAMGVPLPAVMAFWLSSPIMDPSMFLLTVGVLGTEFAIAKTVAAFGLGLLGGFSTWLLMRGGAFANPLRPGIGDGGCAGNKVRRAPVVVWPIWQDRARVATFGKETRSVVLFLGKWLLIAFTLESLMVAYVPAETVAATLGSNTSWALPLSVAIGIPAYLNGYAALGLVGGLVDAGMAPGAGLAFLVAGGVTSIPAAIAVFALARWPVFTWYIAVAVVGSLASGLAYQLWLA